MTCFIRISALFSPSLATLLLLSACGKHPPATPASTVVSSTTAAAPLPAHVSSNTAAAAVSISTAARAKPSTAPVITAAATTPPMAPAAAPLTVAKLTLGSDVNAQHQVTLASSSFNPDSKSIYASVATEGCSGGATLNAKWSYLEGQGQLVSSISQSIATDGAAVTTFKVQNPDLWPEGKYRVDISLDGKPVAKQDFEIKKG